MDLCVWWRGWCVCGGVWWVWSSGFGDAFLPSSPCTHVPTHPPMHTQGGKEARQRQQQHKEKQQLIVPPKVVG